MTPESSSSGQKMQAWNNPDLRIMEISHAIGSTFNGQLSNGLVLRLDLDVCFKSDLAVSCLHSLRCGFPSGLFQVFWRCVVTLRKDPSVLHCSELEIIELCVGCFLFAGFSGNTALLEALNAPSSSSSDWDFLLGSAHHSASDGKPWIRELAHVPHKPLRANIYSVISSSLPRHLLVPAAVGEFLNYLPSLLVCFHLVREDQRLSTLTQHNTGRLGSFLLQLAILLNSKIYQDYYLRAAASLSAATEGSLSIFIQGNVVAVCALKMTSLSFEMFFV